MTTPYRLIETAPALAEQLERWRGAPWLAVDTEFVREETYHAQLCLVQLSDGATTLCVDVLAVDPAPLISFLAEPGTLKVLHSAGQDLELFVQHGGDCPRPLFDTQVAAALLGHGEQLGYAALVERRLGLAVDKSLSRANWARRPLPDAALAYAADDVHHLAALYPPLREELVQRGRLAWLEAESERIADARRYRPDVPGAWRTVRGLGRLPATAQHLAARLASWREQEALARNRPRRWILEDAAVMQLAMRRPGTLPELAQVEGLSARRIERDGEALLALLREPAPDAPPLLADVRETPAQRQQTQLLLDLLRARATQEQVAPTLIATRSDVERLVREGARAAIPLLQGWRRELAGEEMLRALEAGAPAVAGS
jgi:ribonuclease D